MIATMSVLLKKPGWEHRWHSDLENVIDRSRYDGDSPQMHTRSREIAARTRGAARRCDGASWTAWVPVYGTSEASTLHVVTHTHASADLAQAPRRVSPSPPSPPPAPSRRPALATARHGPPPLRLQAVLGDQCKVCKSRPGKPTITERGDTLLAAAHRRGLTSAAHVKLHGADGSSWLFRGATWHGSDNRATVPRLALQMHYMPTRCAFRTHDTAVDIAPAVSVINPAGSWREPGERRQFGTVLPPVIPVLGKSSPSISSDVGVRLRNNWMYPAEEEPYVVNAEFDRTPKRERGSRKNQITPAGGAVTHKLNRSGFVSSMCAVKKGVDASAGVVDASKCKMKLVYGATSINRIIEYHTSKVCVVVVVCGDGARRLEVLLLLLLLLLLS